MAAGPAAAPESPPLYALAGGAPPPPPPQLLLSASLLLLLLRRRRVLGGLGLHAGSELGRGWQSAAAHARAPSFSAPPGGPSARAYIATGRRCRPPRGRSMTALSSVSGGGTRGSSSSSIYTPQRQPQPPQQPPSPRLELPREPGDALHTHNARPGLVLSPERAAGRGPGGGGRGAGMWGGGELPSPALRSSLSAKFHQLQSTAGGSPSRGTLGRAAADWSEVLQPSPPPGER